MLRSPCLLLTLLAGCSASDELPGGSSIPAVPPALPAATPAPSDTASAPELDASTPAAPANSEYARERLRACPIPVGVATRAANRRSGGCELICMDGFSLDLYPRAAWPHGSYRFVVTRDEQVITCEGRLPLEPCGRTSVRCDEPGVGIGESGCALPAADQSFSNISFAGYPAHLEIVAFRDGARIANAVFDPKYDIIELNGEGCQRQVCCGAPTKAFTLWR